MARKHYSDLPELNNIYLEDSFVLDVITTASSAIFKLEVVLTENHPSYKDPLASEHYCFRKAELVFEDAEEVFWKEKVMRPITDATTEIDYGNIDSFFIVDGVFCLQGDWGEIEIKTSKFSFSLEE
jgi:hypothetical protein